MAMSRPVLPIRNRRERRHEVDRRAHGVWRMMPASNWSRGEASRVDGQRNDGDGMSDNQSAEKTWPLDVVLRPLLESGHGVSEASGEARMGVSYSIYELENYSEVYTTYIQEDEHEAMTGKAGEPRAVRKRDYG